ncbi:unnamed protein product [Symbiodinium necroappetens]|uniref:Uncharacterized protein n=1 Tax=Symbiodinium necroappetens TaxID=1628268 RepID=A0A813C0T7_9DINO|nr:unnamed protein product [Symbiodinium necroappetens]
MMFDDIPEKAVEIIHEGKKMKPGATLVRISSDISRPSAKEVSNNFVWLRAICTEFPRKVPSAYLLTDCMLHLDRILRGKLIVPAAAESKVVAAAREAKRLKKLMGTLRTLYRNRILSAIWSVGSSLYMTFCMHIHKGKSSADDKLHLLKGLLKPAADTDRGL